MEKKNLLPIKNPHKLIIYAKYFSIDAVSNDACGYFFENHHHAFADAEACAAITVEIL